MAGPVVAESETRRLLRARDVIDRHYAEPLNVDALAAVALLSPAHFSRRFKRLFGQPPHEYLYYRRIERAKWLLRTGDMSVTDICHAVGYSSLGTFTTTFVRLVGETPTAHRGRGAIGPIPGCITRAWNTESRFGEANRQTDA